MSAYDKILIALEQTGVRIQAGAVKARAQCPVHNYSGLTLSVRRREDRAKVHCLAGCETPEVLTTIGLELRDLCDAPGKPTRPHRPLSPLGNVEHFIGRIEQQARLEASPQYRARRDEAIAACAARPGDYQGGAVTSW